MLDGTTITYEPCGCTRDLFVDMAAERLIDALNTTPIGWLDPAYPPSAHGLHKYDGGCALCRMERPEAMRAVVGFILEEMTRG